MTVQELIDLLSNLTAEQKQLPVRARDGHGDVVELSKNDIDVWTDEVRFDP